MEDIKLETEYVLWYHSVTEKSWSKESYVNLCEDLPDKTIKTVKELWGVYKALHNNFTAGMFFLMKKGILPIWEDPQNEKGGFWSYKVPRKQSNDVWLKLSAAFVGNSLTEKPETMSYMTGISISPKITNCVMKIWNSTASINDTGIFTKEIDYLEKDTIRYNKHKK